LRKYLLRKEALPIFLSVVALGLSHFFSILVKDAHLKMVFFDVFPAALNGLTTVLLFWAARRTMSISPKQGRAWLLFAISQLFFTLGDVTWAVFELVLNISPYPSVADIFYLLNYPFFLAGAVQLTTERFTGIEKIKRVLDMLITLVAAMLGIWFFLIDPMMRAGIDNTLLFQILTVAYPAGDVVLFAALIWLINNDPRQFATAPIFLLFSGAFVTVVFDTMYSYQSYLDIYQSGGILDIGWILSYLLVGLAAIHQVYATQSQQVVSNRLDNPGKIRTWIRSSLPYFPYLWMVFAYLLLIPGKIPTPYPAYVTLYSGVGLVTALVILRQFAALYENSQLNNKLQTALNQVQQQTLVLANTNKDLETEIEQRVRVEEQLSYDALHDSLTRLPNRALFMDRLEQALEETRMRLDRSYSVLFMDIDQFKVVNDSLGHHTGDQLLVIIAKRLENCLRGADTVARLGGDEFVFLIENTATENAIDFIVNRIQEEIQKVIVLDGHPIFITTSIGVVLNLRNYETPGNVLRDADLAMYHAKHMGKDRFEVFHEGLRLQAISRLEIEEGLRSAIKNRELELYYQPIHKLKTNEIVGFEALIRWNHPRYGILHPSDFLAIAEETGLTLPIGRWSFIQVCTQIKKWQKAHASFKNCYISINVSGKQFGHAEFVNQINNILDDSGISSSAIHLEITENALIEHTQEATDKFKLLRELGIHLSIDDFGTGYSSLAYIQHFPVQSLKIDQSFIRELGLKKSSTDLVRAMVLLGQDLGLEVIAEGIESPGQREELIQLTCPFGQGFMLSLPQTANAVDELLLEKNNLAG
jgi:diguanylate cyclase (GGDEF)-like protein